MINKGKFPILGINISAVDYENAVKKIIKAAESEIPFGVSALAVHGVMTGYQDKEHRRRLNGLHLITPDGQPVRWALNWLYNTSLSGRVAGPDLTLYVLKEMEKRGLKPYFYGSKQVVLEDLISNLKTKFPDLKIAGYEPSKFRKLDSDEKSKVVSRIQESRADIVFVGLGCPRQEVWVYEYMNLFSRPALAVGAAFDFHAGRLPKAPELMQKKGFEWLYRLIQEPARLWKRYLILGPKYLILIALQYFNINTPENLQPTGDEKVISYG